eukprot:scaffold4274_cov376-Prasinococcus_capsulatus_cf.AAC.3
MEAITADGTIGFLAPGLACLLSSPATVTTAAITHLVSLPPNDFAPSTSCSACWQLFSCSSQAASSDSSTNSVRARSKPMTVVSTAEKENVDTRTAKGPVSCVLRSKLIGSFKASAPGSSMMVPGGGARAIAIPFQVITINSGTKLPQNTAFRMVRTSLRSTQAHATGITPPKHNT